MRPGVRSRRGFTLLEALTAGAIFFIVVVAVSLLAVQGSTNAAQGMRYAQAARVATQELERWSMRGYADLQTLTGGTSPWSPTPYTVTEQTDGGGKQYDVVVTVVDTTGPPGAAGALPAPQLGTGSIAVPSYFISVQVTTSSIRDAGTPVVVSQASYVSPN